MSEAGGSLYAESMRGSVKEGGNGLSLDPGPAAPPPVAGDLLSVPAGASSTNPEIDKQVQEIKKSALLRLTLAGTRGSNQYSRHTLPSGGNPHQPALTPGQYAHQYRTGERLPLETPDAFGGFARPPQQRPQWPPPPPPASVPREDPRYMAPREDPRYMATAREDPRYMANQMTPHRGLQIATTPLSRGSPYQYNRPNGYQDIVSSPGGQMLPSNVPHQAYDPTVKWKRVVDRDQQGEIVESVKWVREEVLT